MKKLLAILLVLCFATPAIGQMQIYGSLRTHVAYYDIGEDFGGAGPGMDTVLGPDDSGLMIGLSNQSRFGVVLPASRELYGHVEFGLRNQHGGDVDNVYLRLAYGVWDFGNGKLVVGQDYTPATFLGYAGHVGDIGGSGETIMLVAGIPYIGRQPQVKVKFNGFEAAAIKNAQAAGEDHTPRIEVAYTHNTDIGQFKGIAGFSMYKEPGGETVNTFLVGAGANMKFDPAYVKLTASFQQNPGDYGNANLIAPAARTYDAAADEDAQSIQATLAAGYKINDMMTGEIGFGYTMNEVGDLEQDGMIVYAQLPITLDKGMRLTPEFGFVSRGDVEFDGNTVADGDDMMYFALVFQVDF